MNWNERYDREEYVFGIEPNAFLKSCYRLLKPGHTALAVADGEGRNGVWLASQGLRVVGFDASAVGLDKARRLAAREGVEVDYRLASVEDWTWERDGYDVVAAIFIQFAEPLLRALIFEGMIRTLKPGGLLLLQGYTPRQLDYGTGGPRAVENLYAPHAGRRLRLAHDRASRGARRRDRRRPGPFRNVCSHRSCGTQTRLTRRLLVRRGDATSTDPGSPRSDFRHVRYRRDGRHPG